MIDSWFQSHTGNPPDPRRTGSCPRGALADTSAASAPSTSLTSQCHHQSELLPQEYCWTTPTPRCITLLYTAPSEGNMASGGRRTRKSSAMFCRIIFLLSDSSSSSSSTENKSEVWRPDNPLNSQIHVTLLFSQKRGCFAGHYDCPSGQCMTVLEQKLVTAVVTGNTADEGISSVVLVLVGSPDPRNQLMSRGSSDGSTLLRSCFTSDFASEKFIFTISLPLSPVLSIICQSNINLTSSWEVFCLLLFVLWWLWRRHRHLPARSGIMIAEEKTKNSRS